MPKTLREKLSLITDNRQHLSSDHREMIDSYNHRIRNLSEEWADKIIDQYELVDPLEVDGRMDFGRDD